MVLPGTGKVGITTVKALGNRPKRNREKRRIREIAGALGLHLETWDWVIVVKSSAAEAGFTDLQCDFRHLVSEAKEQWASE